MYVFLKKIRLLFREKEYQQIHVFVQGFVNLPEALRLCQQMCKTIFPIYISA